MKTGYYSYSIFTLKNTTLVDFDQENQENQINDFWKEMFDDILMTITLPTVILILIISIPTLLLFLSYLHTKHIRTLLTHAEFIIVFYVLIYQCIPMLMDTIRIVSGPMNPTLCWWNIFFKNFCAFGIELGCCISIVVRVSLLF